MHYRLRTLLIVLALGPLALALALASLALAVKARRQPFRVNATTPLPPPPFIPPGQPGALGPHVLPPNVGPGFSTSPRSGAEPDDNTHWSYPK